MLKMIGKTSGKIILIILSCFVLTGCWSSRELSELAIATAIGIDTHEDGYKVTAQVINPGEIAGKALTTRTATTTYTATGKTLFEAIRKLTTVTPRKVYLSHIRIILVGQEMAEKGIAPALDFLSRDHEMRTDFAIAIAKGLQAEEVIKVLTPLEKVPANKISDSLQTSQDQWAPTKAVQLDELISSLTSEGKQAVLTGIYVEGDPDQGAKLNNMETTDPLTTVHVNHIGVFQGDKLIGWLNESESKGFNYITDNISNTIGWVECGESGTISAEVANSETNITVKLINNQLGININTKIKADIGEVQCDIDLYDQANIKKIEQKFEERTEQIINSSITKAKEFKSDIFGFGEEIKRSQPKLWEELKQNWNREFVNVKVELETEFKISRTGTTTESFMRDIPEKNKGNE